MNKAQIQPENAEFLHGIVISDNAYYMDESTSRQIAITVPWQPGISR
jgi:hypothetical protein